LDDNGKAEYFRHAWREYKVSRSTSLLESFSSGFIFAQMSAKAGLKKYGEDAKICLIAEFKQLMDYDVFHGRNASELTCHQKQKATIEEKINRGHTEKNPVIKARSVYNEKVQRGLYSKETASPTVS